MTTEKIEEVLKENEYFRGLRDIPRRELAEIIIAKTLKKSDTLFHEGQTGYGFFLLVAGAIRVSRTSQDGRETVIKILKPGEVFGEVVLFERKEYPARAQALEASQVFIIPKKQIICLLEGEAFRSAFLGLVMNKLRYLTERLLYLTAHDVEERFFIFLREHFGEKPEYRITLSKKDFASAVGTNPETFSRLITRLKKEGRIDWKNKTLRIRR